MKAPALPEKIYGWQDSQLSVARFYGGMRYMETYYRIDENDPKKPLVRDDVYRAEAKARRDGVKISKPRPTQLGMF